MIIRSAIDRGLTFMDNCWDYNGGASEIRVGKALCDGYRQRVFLMTKIDGRTKAAAARQIDQSLQRLQTDRIDSDTKCGAGDVLDARLDFYTADHILKWRGAY